MTTDANTPTGADFIPTPTDLIRYRLTVIFATGVEESADDPDNGQPRIFATREAAEQFGRDLIDYGNAHSIRVEADGEATLAACNAYWKAREHQALVAIEDARLDVAALMPQAEQLRSDLAAARSAADAMRSTVRYLDTPAGGLWAITAQRDSAGNMRVMGTHYPTGEIREATATAESQGIAAALLQLGNTIAYDWDQPQVSEGGFTEETARALRSIREEVDYLRRQVDEAEEAAGRAYSKAEDALGYISEVEQPLERAKDQAGEAQEYAQEASGSLGRIEEALGRMEDDQ